jgi:hypothetical protein
MPVVHRRSRAEFSTPERLGSSNTPPSQRRSNRDTGGNDDVDPDHPAADRHAEHSWRAAAVRICSHVPGERRDLYACVKKNGSARVFTKKPKCKKGEKKLSWNNEGPAGKNGVNGTNGTKGTNGTNGTNGAVAGYSARNTGAVNILEGTIPEPIAVVTKSIPAGSYLVFAKSTIAASDSTVGDKWTAECQLSDIPVSGEPTFDQSNATGEVITNFIFKTGYATVPLGMAISTTTASTLTLACTHVWDVGGTKLAMSATESLITAVQTSHNA